MRCAAAQGRGFPDESGIEEERAGEGPGRNRGMGCRLRPATSIQSAGGALTDRMTAETLRVRADIACVTYTCTCTTVTTAEVVFTLFRSIKSKMSLESQIRTTGINGSLNPALNPTLYVADSIRYLDLTACSSGSSN